MCDQLCKAKRKNVEIDSEDNLDECFCDGAGTDSEEAVDTTSETGRERRRRIRAFTLEFMEQSFSQVWY